MPPYWSRPPKGNELEFLIDTDWLDGTQCVNYVIMFDETAERLVVRYRWVF